MLKCRPVSSRVLTITTDLSAMSENTASVYMQELCYMSLLNSQTIVADLDHADIIGTVLECAYIAIAIVSYTV